MKGQGMKQLASMLDRRSQGSGNKNSLRTTSLCFSTDWFLRSTHKLLCAILRK